MKLLDCALLGACAIIRWNTVLDSHQDFRGKKMEWVDFIAFLFLGHPVKR